tara:strand:+ start:78 stop:407 length:330 start_codon:yes stop_codon:yes gene_type:complete
MSLVKKVLRALVKTIEEESNENNLIDFVKKIKELIKKIICKNKCNEPNNLVEILSQQVLNTFITCDWTDCDDNKSNELGITMKKCLEDCENIKNKKRKINCKRKCAAIN